VRCIADVRTMPRSRTNPQFNADALPPALAAAGIAYEHIGALGGLRPKSRDIAPEVNAFWENASFHNYADYAMGPAFAEGVARLRALGDASALMCAEGLWWRCHRRIVADYLLAAGDAVRHIMPDGKVAPARMTPAARAVGGVLTYSRAQA
jgi:uncharacterized protein (DUF488 family)